MDDPIALDFARLRAVREARTGNLGELARIAELNPTTDFRFADLRGADWEGTDLGAFNLEGAETGMAPAYLLARLERQRLLYQACNWASWKVRLDSSLTLLSLYPEDEKIKEQLAVQMLTDRSAQYRDAVFQKIDPFKITALKDENIGDFLYNNIPQNLRRVDAVARWIAFGGKPIALPWLKYIRSRNAEFSDISAFSELKSLKKIELKFVSVKDLTSISNLGELNELIIHYIPCDDLEPLSSLRSLKRLDVWSSVKYDLSSLAHVKSLTYLKLALWGNQVLDLSFLYGLRMLRTLILRGSRLTDTSAISGLSRLRSLDLGRTELNDLSNVANLKELNVLNIDQTAVTNLEPLEKMTKLQYLDLSKTKVSDLSPLSGLTELRRLDVSGLQISNFAPLDNIPRLRVYGKPKAD